MRLFAAVTIFAGLLSCGGGSGSPTPAGIPQAEACTQASQSICGRVFSCTDTILLLAQVALGGSPAGCQNTIQQNYCSTIQCTAGQTYHADRAQECKDQFSTVSCMALADAAMNGGVAAALEAVPACQQVCTGGSDAAMSGG